MNLKCIGGLCDGQFAHVDDYYGYGDQVGVPMKVEFNLPTFEEDLQAFRENRTPEYMINPFEYYKIEEFYFGDNKRHDKIKFLIPLHWKIKDAMLHLLK